MDPSLNPYAPPRNPDAPRGQPQRRLAALAFDVAVLSLLCGCSALPLAALEWWTGTVQFGVVTAPLTCAGWLGALVGIVGGSWKQSWGIAAIGWAGWLVNAAVIWLLAV